MLQTPQHFLVQSMYRVGVPQRIALGNTGSAVEKGSTEDCVRDCTKELPRSATGRLLRLFHLKRVEKIELDPEKATSCVHFRVQPT
jgi:hypothetical protein